MVDADLETIGKELHVNRTAFDSGFDSFRSKFEDMQNKAKEQRLIS